jgi:hypothetical protein
LWKNYQKLLNIWPIEKKEPFKCWYNWKNLQIEWDLLSVHKFEILFFQ